MKRLVLCLDGTWNNRDDCTNVLHQFNLTQTGAVTSGGQAYEQELKYIRGVGTGPVDKISGGAFGFGLEANVRAAYDWLIERFEDNPDGTGGCEIYVFGFSRGAYTARSLVGFISRLGLLRRGAPLTVSELWEDYCILGRENEQRTSLWDTVFGADPTRHRAIGNLVKDPWDLTAQDRRDCPPGHVPGQKEPNLNAAEKLLVRWSRRVKITYLGIYDTVGAMGIDALAIPGLKSKLALHNNMRPTRLIQRCRHALALDEHRSSFVHTPFLRYAGLRQEAGVDWEAERRDWNRRIEQRWFVGAHANIGGGYPDNELSRAPLAWVFEGAGLVVQPVLAAPIVTPLRPRDSYREFVPPLWATIIRAKRSYRTIDPPVEVRGGLDGRTGFSLTSINEVVNASVAEQWRSDPDYRPPNLIRYARKRLSQNLPLAGFPEIAAERPRHVWLPPSRWEYAAFALWGTIISGGACWAQAAVCADPEVRLPWPTMAAAAVFFVVIDWLESHANFRLALGSPRREGWRAGRSCSDEFYRAALDSLYWVRTGGVILFFAGAVLVLIDFWQIGWISADLPWLHAAGRWFSAVWPWAVVAAAAGAAAIAGTLLDRPTPAVGKAAWWGGALGVLAAGLVGVVAALLGYLLHQVLQPLLPPMAGAGPSATLEGARFAGQLIALQVALICLFRAIPWANEPIATSHLGSMRELEMKLGPAKLAACLGRWRDRLLFDWGGSPDELRQAATEEVRRLGRAVLWRDLIGLIPLSCAVLAYGLWFCWTWLQWDWLRPFWLMLPLFAALAKSGRAVCYFRCLKKWPAARHPTWMLTALAFIFSLLKNLVFLAEILVIIAGVGVASWRLAAAGLHSGWRGSLGLLLTWGTVLTVAAILVGALARRRSNRVKQAAGMYLERKQ